MMPPFDRFGLVAAVLYTGNAERARLLDAEMRRVGAEGYLPVWQFPTPYDAVIRSRVRCTAGMSKPGYFSSGLGHYRAVKTALCLGADSVLVVEDDVRFPRDAERLARGLADAPEGYDVLLLDSFRADDVPPETVLRAAHEGRHGSTCWCRAWPSPLSFACYAMSRRAMEWWTGEFERPCADRATPLRVADRYLDARRIPPDLSVWFAHPNLAVQRALGASNSRGRQGFDAHYESVGVRMEDYAC